MTHSIHVVTPTDPDPATTPSPAAESEDVEGDDTTTDGQPPAQDAAVDTATTEPSPESATTEPSPDTAAPDGPADDDAVEGDEPAPPDPDRAADGARRVLVATIAVTAIVLLVVGIAVGAVLSGLEPAPALPREIERIIPGDGAAILRQDSVGVDLEATYQCNLQIDGIQIPPDQLTGTDEVGECLYRPGPDQEIEEFTPGRHDVLVTFWPATDPTAVKFHRFIFEVR